MSQHDQDMPRLSHVEPLTHESISHYLGRLRRFKANSLPSAYSLGQVAGIGAVVSRWEKLYFNPFPTYEELAAIACLIDIDVSRLQAMLPQQGITFQPRPIRLCGECYKEEPCHRMDWQYKSIVVAACPYHKLRLLEKCPHCKTAFKIPALWSEDGRCDRCKMRFTSMVKYQEEVKINH